MRLIHHYKEKYEQRQQFCIDLLNKSSEAVAVLKKLYERVKSDDDSTKAPAAEADADDDAAGSTNDRRRSDAPDD